MRELTTDEMKMVSGGLRPPDAASANFALASAPMGGFDATPRPGFGYGSFGPGRSRFSNLGFCGDEIPSPLPELPPPPGESMPEQWDDGSCADIEQALRALNTIVHVGAGILICGQAGPTPLGALCVVAFALSHDYYSDLIEDEFGGARERGEPVALVTPPSGDTGMQ